GGRRQDEEEVGQEGKLGKNKVTVGEERQRERRAGAEERKNAAAATTTTTASSASSSAAARAREGGDVASVLSDSSDGVEGAILGEGYRGHPEEQLGRGDVDVDPAAAASAAFALSASSSSVSGGLSPGVDFAEV
ncbi:unnamed protein product, partial [Laminaria digitata]